MTAHIAIKHVSFNCIRQVAPIRTTPNSSLGPCESVLPNGIPTGSAVLARDVIYTFRAYAMMSMSICLSVCL